MRFLLLLACAVLLLHPGDLSAQAQPAPFPWPQGKRAAVSLSFDDARTSQAELGPALFAKHGARVTFYVVPSTVEQRLDGWKQLVAGGHEIGNHSLVHPCSGNFPFARNRAIEDYSLQQMHDELVAANGRIRELLGVAAETFAYPCGQTFVGRGLDTRSYVPVVAGLFAAGRTYMDEAPNDPRYCDFAQLTGVNMDALDFEQVRPLLEQAVREGAWLVLAGHEIGESGRQTTRVRMLEQLLAYAADPASGLWLAPVNEVARYVREHR